MWKKFINCITILEIDKLEIISIFEILSSILHIFNLSIIQKNRIFYYPNSNFAFRIKKNLFNTKRDNSSKDLQTFKNPRAEISKSFYRCIRIGVNCIFLIEMKKLIRVWTKLENLARLLYTNLFNWMVAKINKILEKSTEDYFKHSELHKKYQTIKNTIHVVEFAPFNSTNSIKGLSINIANEVWRRITF
jgi:myosin heavy subunit